MDYKNQGFVIIVSWVTLISLVKAQTNTTTTTTTSNSMSAVIVITTPSLTSSVLTLEHNMTTTGAEVTIRCSGTEGLFTSSLYSLKMSRVLNTFPNATPTTLLRIFHHNQEPQVLYPLEGAAAFGSVTQNYLTLRMTRTRCQDAGLYICEASYLTDTVYIFTINQSLVVNVKPGYLSILSYPSYTTWSVNNTVTLTCSGPVGTADSNSQIVWHWEYWDKVNLNWQRYAPPPSDVIPQGTNKLTCYETGGVSVRRTLQMADSERNYRCYVERNGLTYEEYAGKFVFGRVLSDYGGATVGASTAEERYKEGLAVGGGIGTAAAVAFFTFVCIIRYACLGKRKCLACGDVKTMDSVHKQPENGVAMETKHARSVALQTAIHNDDNNGLARLQPPEVTTTAIIEESPGEESAVAYDDVLDLAAAHKQQAAAEDALHRLLTTRHVLSYRVTGHQGYTSFILHLTPSYEDAVYSGLQHGKWHKKKRGFKSAARAAVAAPSSSSLPQRISLPNGDTVVAGAKKGGQLALPEAPSYSSSARSPRRKHKHKQRSQ